MKEKTQPLRLYNFSHPLMQTEVFSIASDKYAHSMSFSWEITSDYGLADVILWDGIITVRNTKAVEKMLSDIKTGKVLLLIGESMSLLKSNPMVRIQNTENLNCVELPGWNILPEELLPALLACYKKSKHV
jgi:Ni,Fe-hydrogenase III small subunit